MKKSSIFTTAITLSLSAAMAFGLVAHAQSTGNTGGQALEIAPPVITLSVDPGQVVTAKISLRDVSNGKLFVTNQINDFVAAGEDGTPKILLDTNEKSAYSMKDWISPLSNLTLNPKQIQSLPITIKVPSNASPGGYYAVIRFTATPPELKDTGVSLSASLGALLLVRVKGVAKENLTVKEFVVQSAGKTGWLFESTPLQFVERLENKGNTHEQPAGQVTITDMFGKKVAKVNINLPPRDILPQSIRKFNQPLDSTVIGDRILFGLYTAQMRVVYGDSKSVITSSLTFWVIPWRLILLIILLLVGGFVALFYGIRRYNRHIVDRALQSKKHKRR